MMWHVNALGCCSKVCLPQALKATVRKEIYLSSIEIRRYGTVVMPIYRYTEVTHLAGKGLTPISLAKKI